MRLGRRLERKGRIPPRLIAVTITAMSLIVIATVVLAFQQDSGNAHPSDPDSLPAAAQPPQAAGSAGTGTGGAQTGGAAAPGAPGAPAEGEAGGNGTSQSAAGPVTEVDKKFLIAVRRAGLWEIPAGRLAQTNSNNEAVKRAGHHLIDGHAMLDQLVREDAKILGVQIPNEASEEQQGWVAQMKAARGAEFDRIFVNLLRAAHGKVFALIGEVRAATQNDLIRRHSKVANETVLDHLEVLEDTGLVTKETLEDVEAAVSS
ncbi:DUF4142 domain-containing protein [Streptomyces alkaliterrae]|nr:DUF4142 domain-containing protein [Streptomyces alkaliterrae]